MVTVKSLQTTLGELGMFKKDETRQVGLRRAQLMEEKGLVEILSEDDGTEEPEIEIKGGVRIKDHRGRISYTDDKDKIKKYAPIRIGKEPVATAEGEKMPTSYGPAIVGEVGPELVQLPNGTTVAPVIADGEVDTSLSQQAGKLLQEEAAKAADAEKAESDKAEPGEVKKVEVKETPKKNYK